MTEEQQPQEAKKVSVEVCDSIEKLPLDERMVKAFEKIAEQTFLNIQKRDYRATVVHREEKGEVPDAISTFVTIDEDKKDQLDNPTELDVKGTITPFEAMQFKDVNYAMALAKLKNWAYFEETVDVYEDGRNVTKMVKVPVNLAQIDMLSKKWLNLSVFGNQSSKHIKALRAGSGMPIQDGLEQKAAGWFGWKRERVAKEELKDAYGDKQ